MKNEYKGFIKALKNADQIFINRDGDTVYVLNPYSGVELNTAVYNEFFVKDSPCFPAINDGEKKSVCFSGKSKNSFEIRDSGLKDPASLFNVKYPDALRCTNYIVDIHEQGTARIILGENKGLAINTMYVDAVRDFGGVMENAEGETTGIVRVTAKDVRFIMLSVRLGEDGNALINALLNGADHREESRDMKSYRKQIRELEDKVNELEKHNEQLRADYTTATSALLVATDEATQLKEYIKSIESKAIAESDANKAVETVETVKEPEEVKGIEVFDVEAYLTEVEGEENRITDSLIEALDETEDLKAELIGTWLWVTGNTREHKDVLKALGFRWSGKKQAWYMAPSAIKSNYRARYSNMDAVRQAHVA